MIDAKEHLTVDQVFDKYPELGSTFNWGVSSLSNFVKCHLLHGQYLPSVGLVVREESLMRLIDFVNQRFEDQKIKFANG